MFKLQINSSFGGDVTISGCPESGIAAVDWRRDRGIKEAPSNKLNIRLHSEVDGMSDEECERLVRELGGGDNDADIVFSTDTSYIISPEAAAAWCRQDYAPAIRELYLQRQAEEREREEEQAREEAEKQARIASLVDAASGMSPEDLIHRVDGYGRWIAGRPQEWYREWGYGAMPEPMATIMRDAQAAAKARNEDEEREREEMRKLQDAACLLWAAEHGSDEMLAAAADHVLDPKEAKDAWREATFAPVDWPEYVRMELDDVCDCDSDDECSLDCEVETVPTLPLELYPGYRMLMDRLRTLLPGSVATIRKHTCRATECNSIGVRYGVLVSVEVGNGLKFCREFTIA